MRNKQLDQLYKSIVEVGKFNYKSIEVYPIEASVGKTYTMVKALIEIGKKGKKFLIVTKLKKEQELVREELAKELGDKVIVYNSDTREDYQVKDVAEAVGVIISHQMYKRLVLDRDRARIFIEGRDVVVIDEEIELVEVYYLEERTIKQVKSMISSVVGVTVAEQYIEITKPIIQAIGGCYSVSNNMRWFEKHLENSSIENAVESLLESIRGTKIPKDYFRGKIVKSKNELLDHVNSLRYFYNTNKIIVDENGIYSANLSVKHLHLHPCVRVKKVILLDASASFVEKYNSKQFNLKPFERVVDHSNTTLIHYKKSSSKMSKDLKGVKESTEEIMEYINKNTIKNDNCIVFGSKSEVDRLKGELEGFNADIVTFEGSRGKNDWGGCNKAFIIHTPALKPVDYIFRFLYYFPEEAETIIGDNNAIKLAMGEGGCWTFTNNKRLHLLRTTDIASNFYQALKRIDRNHDNRLSSVEMHIITNNLEAVEIVQRQLLNLGWVRIVTCEKKKQGTKEYNNAIKVLEVLSSLDKGTYKKKEVREKAGIGGTMEWSRALKQVEILRGKDYLEEMGIKEKGHCYIVQRDGI